MGRRVTGDTGRVECVRERMVLGRNPYPQQLVGIFKNLWLVGIFRSYKTNEYRPLLVSANRHCRCEFNKCSSIAA